MMFFLLSRCEDEKPFALKYEVSKEKAKSLGINFIPLEVSVVDTIECLKDKGFLGVWILCYFEAEVMQIMKSVMFFFISTRIFYVQEVQFVKM